MKLRLLKDKAKAKAILTLLLLSLARSHGSAGQVEPRFDGVWSGVEIIQGYFVRSQLGGGQTPGRLPAVIAIGDSGKMFGVLQGLTPGRANVSPKSDGNTLIYKLPELHPKGAHGLFFGRTDGKLVLSADGNTLTETANAILPGTRRPVYCFITGTFHRQPKK